MLVPSLQASVMWLAPHGSQLFDTFEIDRDVLSLLWFPVATTPVSGS